MDDVTLPRSFEDTTPAEMMKDFPRQRSSQSRSPILRASRQPSNYQSISPTTSNTQRTQGPSEPAHESDTSEQEEPHDESPSRPWFGKRIWNAFRGWEQDNLELVLENKQSVARDHLANERTYLAWLRTSLSFASIGVAITQLFRLSTTIQPGTPPKGYAELRRLGRPLGACFVGIAVLVLALGVHRYFTSQYWMTQGKFPASRGAVLVVSSIAASITIAAFVIVVVVDPDLEP